MEIINVKAFKRERASGQPLLRVVGNKLMLSTEAVTVLFGDNKPRSIDVEFGMKDGQLHIRCAPYPNDNSVEVRAQKNGAFEIYNKGFADHVKGLGGAKEVDKTVQMLIVKEPVEDGWHPVITSYWKSLNK
jgi:hypothetical protein